MAGHLSERARGAFGDGQVVCAGFETAIQIPGGAKLYAVRALDASGQALASSKAVAPE